MLPVLLTLAESKDFLKLCSQGRLYEVTHWIASGKTIHVAPESKSTPLDVALDLGFHSLVELLIRHETDQSEKDRALKRAVELRRFDLVQLLVVNGADPLSIPFADVLCEWNPEVVRFFLAKGADVVMGAPFTKAFRYKIRTAIGPYLEVKRAHPEFARELQEQADRALRFFCYKGNLKWVSLLMWAGADPRSKGPSLHEWSDETDADAFTTAIEEACSSGRLDILKRLRIDPKKDDLREPLNHAGWSCDEHLIKYILELGVNPNDKPNGGSGALDRCFQNFSIVTWRYHGRYLGIQTWELTSYFNCVRVLLEHKARWIPDSEKEIGDLRRNLLKCVPQVTIEFVTILKSNGASSDDTLRKLLSTPKMKSHMRSEEKALNLLGLRNNSKRGKSENRQGNTSRPTLQLSYRLLQKYSRDTLYMEVWEEPVKNLCKKYAISDVALAKVCKKLMVPLPGRGYWAKKRAGLRVKSRPELPRI